MRWNKLGSYRSYLRGLMQADVPLFDTALIHAEKAAELSVVGDTDER